MIFQNFSQIFEKDPLGHYSSESIAVHLAPWICFNSCTRSLGGNKTEEAHGELDPGEVVAGRRQGRGGEV